MSRVGSVSVALVLLLSALSAVTMAPRSAIAGSPNWWDSSWSRRAEIAITENSGSTLTDYQVEIVVLYDSDMQSDFDDIRFIDSDDATELFYWCESYSADSTATFWVKVPSISASSTETIRMYYGNPSVANASNIHSTFIWGDDFDNPTWTSGNIHQVNYGGSSQYIENSQYHMEGLAKSEPIAEIYESGSLKQFPANYVVEVEVNPVIKAGGAYITPRYDSVMDKYECVLDLQWSGAELNKVVNNGWTNIEWTGLGYTVEAGSWYKLKAITLEEGSTNRLQVYVNDFMYIDRTDSELSYAGLAFLTYDWNDDFHVAYDNFRVCQYASQEPSTSIGPEEHETGNHPPVLDPIGDKTVNEGELLEFTVSATDPDEDPLTYSASNLPDGADFTPSTQTFSWTPGAGQAGSYPDVHFEVTDGEIIDFEDITITVLGEAPNWWDSSWSRRAEIAITENSGSTLTDYQVEIVVLYDSDMQSDFDDIRFIDSDDATELFYWCESYSADSTATFWVKVPSISASSTETIRMYYGNPSVANASNIHSTFIWGDDFDNPTWTSGNIHQVNYGGSSQYIENSQYHMEGLAKSEPIAEIYESGSLKQFPANYVVEVEVNPVIKAGGAYITPRYDSVMDKYECVLDLQWSGAELNKVVNNGWTNIEWTGLGYTVEAGSWYKLKAITLEEGSTNRLQVYVNDFMYIDRTDSELSYAGLAFLTYDWNDDFHVAYDNFRVREYASQESTTSIGPGEQL